MASDKNRKQRRIRQTLEDLLLVVIMVGTLMLLVTLLFR